MFVVQDYPNTSRSRNDSDLGVVGNLVGFGRSIAGFWLRAGKARPYRSLVTRQFNFKLIQKFQNVTRTIANKFATYSFT
jgi:hypothetical protein